MKHKCHEHLPGTLSALYTAHHPMSVSLQSVELCEEAEQAKLTKIHSGPGDSLALISNMSHSKKDNQNTSKTKEINETIIFKSSQYQAF